MRVSAPNGNGDFRSIIDRLFHETLKGLLIFVSFFDLMVAIIFRFTTCFWFQSELILMRVDLTSI